MGVIYREIDGSAATSEPTTVNLTFASNGDTNGLVYYYGSNAGTQAFSNPYPAILDAVSNDATVGVDGLPGLTDRVAGVVQISTVANADWFALQLPSNAVLQPDNITLRNRSDAGGNGWLRTFRVEGSNDVATFDSAGVDAATWDVLLDVNSDDSLMAADAYNTWAIATTGTSYRWFRLFQDGAAGGGLVQMTIGEWEWYGTLDIT